MTVLKDEMDKLRTDNIKLYEKIRFLQSYKHSKVKLCMVSQSSIPSRDSNIWLWLMAVLSNAASYKQSSVPEQGAIAIDLGTCNRGVAVISGNYHLSSCDKLCRHCTELLIMP